MNVSNYNEDTDKIPQLNEYNENKTMYLNKTKELESETQRVAELNENTNKEYMLLIIWFMIAIFIFIITIMTVITESGLNSFAIIIVILFLLYMLYYFMANIYFMFK
jgi:hypothetical protein